MISKKTNNFIIYLILSIFIYSCVDDDVCDKQVTPNLTIAFIDSSSQVLTLDSLYIDKINSDGTISQEGEFSKVDSVRVPLNSLSNKTVYYLYKTKNATESQKDIITVTYNTDQSFVSKACGFKVFYKDVNYQLTQSYQITNINPITTNIENESKDLYITY